MCAYGEHLRPRVVRFLTAVCCAAWLWGSGQGSAAEIKAKTAPRIASVEGGIEAAIDAPWRLEPDPGSARLYPTIPIVVSIHDANQQPVTLGPFCEIAIREGDSAAFPTVFRTAASIDEIERSDVWPNAESAALNHRLCRPKNGQDCFSDLNVGSSAEWHATVLYTPQGQTPGTDVHLTVQVRVARAGFGCVPPKAIVQSAPFDRLGVHPADPNSFIITNRLSVHLGEAPLPRFDEGWVYGDLHYHSQGTDNEGESAYAYRPTLQAMRAMGLDFLFATDHASASPDGQITNIEDLYLDLPDYVPDAIEAAVAQLHPPVLTYAGAARDMHSLRFAAMRALLNDPPGSNPDVPTGANAEVMKVPGRSRAARIFLGGEVDVTPEISTAERDSGHLMYGNNASYYWPYACYAFPSILGTLAEWTSVDICPSGPSDLVVPAGAGRFLLHDLQGLGETDKNARQHLLHLPSSGSQDETRDNGFVASRTSIFGGANRRLVDVLHQEYGVLDKGYTFLAHPVDAASGTGFGRLGPDIVPYSDVQLRTAFESPAFLGLQLWNEDTRLRSSMPWGFPLQTGQPSVPVGDVGVPSMWHWRSWEGLAPEVPYRDLHHGLVAWDKMLLWGIRRAQTNGLTGLVDGTIRRVFMAGGSDAHGDWNYRREGRVEGVSGIVDTAIGKPRNLLYVGPERPESVTDLLGTPYGTVGQEQVTEALASGTFSITDGPALRIAMDANGNGVIDEGDVPMGGLAPKGFRGAYMPFVVEWKSTDEFGPIRNIDLYVGVAHDASDTGTMYAAPDHGVHSASTPSGAVDPHPYVGSAGRQHWALRDGYMKDPAGALRITPGAAEAKAGRRAFWLRANDYPVGRARYSPAVPSVCTPNYAYCDKPGEIDEECEWECTDEQPASWRFLGGWQPDRMFVRAFARTAPSPGDLCTLTGFDRTPAAVAAQQTGRCAERLAFTNPVWADNTVPPATFTINCTPASLTPAANTSTCTVTATSGVPGKVTLHCAGLPASAACSFNPPSLTLAENGTAQSTMTVAVALGASGTHPFQVVGQTLALPFGPSADLVLTVSAPSGSGDAVFDAAQGVPACPAFGSSCDTGAALVRGRSTARETHAPNTIAATCADGPSGTGSSSDRVKVATLDQTTLAVGKTARIDATVNVPSGAVVDFFYAPDANEPAWMPIDTVVPAAEGAQTLSALYRLPAGILQAVRVQVRDASTDGPCASGDTNDRDDLVFAVAAR